VSARDARSRAARDRPTTGTTRSGGAGRRSARAANDNPVRPAARRSGTSTGSDVAATKGDRSAADGLVIGTVPPSARITGAVLVLAGLVGTAAPFPTYLVVGGKDIAQAAGVGSALVALLVPLTHLVVGAGLVRRAVPKFGLAYAGVAGALAVGQLLIELYRGSSATSRPAVEVIAGERVLTTSVDVGTGWVLGVLALGLTVAAALCAVGTWGRTVMEDAGSLDGVRSGLAGGAVLLGVATVLCLSLPAADVPAQLVTDPDTGMQTVVTREGPQALLERPGLALLGGLLLAGAVVLCSVIAPSLRPRLAAVGGLLAIAVVVLAAGLSGARDALTSPDLEWTLPGVVLLLAGLGYGGLTALAWRMRRGRVEHS
jgi:iron complex transport system permease protein